MGNLKEVYQADTHKAGNTYRLLLRSVEMCTSGKDRTILLCFSNASAAMHAMQQLKTILLPIGDFSHVAFPRGRAEFQNGSRIIFWFPDRGDYFRGMRLFDYALDQSLDRLDPELLATFRSMVRSN